MPNTSTGPITPPPGGVPGRPPSREDAPDVSRRTTNALKGVAILGVVFSHYADHLMGHNPMLVSAFNGYMGLFFILSGYGVQGSLGKRFASGMTAKIIGRFWMDRALRIYPAYLLALYVSENLSGTHYGFAVYSGFMSPYWFITSILHCYLAAPLFFAWQSRMGPVRFSVLITLSVLVINIAYAVFFPSVSPAWAPLVIYKNVLLGHLLLFAWGMSLFAMRDTKRCSLQALPRFASPNLVGVAALVLCFPVGGLLGSASLGIFLLTASVVIYYLLLLAVSRAAFAGSLPLPGLQLLAAVGKATLIIYLFEPFYYYFVGARILTPGALSTPFLYALTLSGFILLCIVAQPAFDLLARLPFRLRPRS